MVTKDSPILKITRFLEPNLDTNCVELIDITDAVETIQRVTHTSKKPPNHFPILRIPSHSNDVLVGEELFIAFVLGNTTSIKFTNVLLKVEMIMEHGDTLETCTILENLELDPGCKPIETKYTYLFKEASRYKMSCSLEYSLLKEPLVIKKMFMWNCTDPVKLTHTLTKLPGGAQHLETQIENKSKTLLVLKEIKLENMYDNKVYFPLEKFSTDNLCVLRHDETYSLIFPNIHVNYTNTANSKDSSPSKKHPVDDFNLHIDWYSYTNISGIHRSKVDVFSDGSDIFYKADLPNKVKVNVPFNLQIFLKNLTRHSVEVLFKFKPSNVFMLQNVYVENINLKKTETLTIPIIATCSGLHELDCIELHCNNNHYPLKNLQVLVTD